MEDLHRVGGIPALLKYLLNEGLVDGSTLSVTGKTMAENLEGKPITAKGFFSLTLASKGVEPLDFTKQDVVRPLDKALKTTGHITILRGNLAPDSAVAKLTGKEGLKFEVGLDHD